MLINNLGEKFSLINRLERVKLMRIRIVEKTFTHSKKEHHHE
jgi:hypothetical protein